MTEFNADIVILMKLIEKLSSQEIINLCFTSKKWRNICEKNEDTIWKRKLLLDYKILPDEIIGNPKSYYLGLERKIGWYYFYQFEDIYSVEGKEEKETEEIEILKVKLAGHEEPQYDDSFFVPGMKEPKGEEILFAHFFAWSKYASENIKVIGKNIENVIQKLIEEIKYQVWEDIEDNVEIYNAILNLTPDNKFQTEAIIMSGYGGDIPFLYKIEFFLYKIVLP